MSDSSTVLRRLNWVKWLAIIDAVLLVPLVIAAVTDTHSVVSVLGPVHGFGFVGLCALIGIGALEGLWGWWFLLVTIVTLGPPGSLWGEWRIRRQIKARDAAVVAV